jgi:hypothetical protein
MSTARDLRRIALALTGSTEAPHFDRTAFRVRRIYATLAADGKTANFMFSSEQQEFKCMMAPEAFAPVPNAWGKRGTTTATLANLTNAELEDALRIAWSRALSKKPRQWKQRSEKRSARAAPRSRHGARSIFSRPVSRVSYTC